MCTPVNVDTDVNLVPPRYFRPYLTNLYTSLNSPGIAKPSDESNGALAEIRKEKREANLWAILKRKEIKRDVEVIRKKNREANLSAY